MMQSDAILLAGGSSVLQKQHLGGDMNVLEWLAKQVKESNKLSENT